MRMLIPLALVAMLTFAPAASAQDEKPDQPTCADGQTPESDGCSQQAWVDDCPPDMMCAAGGADNGTEEPTYGDCGGEVCAYGNGTGNHTGALGPDDCIDCMTPPRDGSGTCMDGAEAGEACRDDVQYLDGPSRGPGDGSCEHCRGEDVEETADPDGRDTPTVGPALLVAGLAALVALARRT
jgi:hypothetical protein